MSGRGFWDVVYEHPIECSIVTIIGIWTIRGMWSDFWQVSAITDLVKEKLKSRKDQADSADQDNPDNPDKE